MTESFSTEMRLAEPINSEALMLLMGFDPDDLHPVAPVSAGRFEVRVDSIECPVWVPRKRRGLTGKRYRIARRRYHREMKAYRRGEIEPIHLRRVLYNVGIRGVEQVPGSSSMSIEMGVLPVTAPDDPWYDLPDRPTTR